MMIRLRKFNGEPDLDGLEGGLGNMAWCEQWRDIL